MQTVDRTRGALDDALTLFGKGHDRPVELFFDLGRQDPDDALMPVRFIQANAVRRAGPGGVNTAFQLNNRLGLHVILNLPPLPVQVIESGRHFFRGCGIVREQAFYAERHIGQAPGRVQAGRDTEAEVGGGQIRD